MKKITLLLLLIITYTSFSQILVTETFDYPDGNLIGNGTWTAHSGAGSTPIQVASGKILITHGAGSREDVNIPFTEQTSGTIYASFDFSINDPGSSIAGTDYEYFAHFSSTNFNARMDIVSPTSSGDFSVGISSASSTAEAIWSTDLTYNTTYKVVIRYNIDNGKATLWINPSLETDTSIEGSTLGAGTSISDFVFRQSNSTSDETIIIDNLKVGKTFNETTLSTKQSLSQKNIRLYPNPLNKSTTLKITGLSTINKTYVNIYNALGAKVINTVLKNNSINTSLLPSGIYLVEIIKNHNRITKKLIIK